MVITDIVMQRARTGDIEVTVSNVENWDGLLAKLYVAEDYSEPEVFGLNGVIDTNLGVITFSYTINDSQLLTSNRYVFEVVLYNDDKSFAQTTTRGTVIVEPIIKTL